MNNTVLSLLRHLLIFSVVYVSVVFSFPIQSRADYPSVRASILHLQAAQVGDYSERVILLGDSITDGFYLHTLSGYEVFNAGIGSAGVEHLLAVAPNLVKTARTRIAVLCIGINDANKKRPFSIKNWEETYRHLCKNIAQHVRLLYIQTLFPVEHNKSLGDMYFDTERIRLMNDSIRQIASQEGYFLIDAFAHFATPEGFMPPGATHDGVHPRPETYARWRTLLEQTVADTTEQSSVRE